MTVQQVVDKLSAIGVDAELHSISLVHGSTSNRKELTIEFTVQSGPEAGKVVSDTFTFE